MLTKTRQLPSAMSLTRIRLVVIVVAICSLQFILWPRSTQSLDATPSALVQPQHDEDKQRAFEQLAGVHAPLHEAERFSWDYRFGTNVGGYKWFTESALRRLTACEARNECHPNAHKVVIFAAFHCHLAVFANYNGGEGVWCRGMMESLERQGYTVLLTRNDWAYTYHIYRQIPHLVKAIIGDPKGSDDEWYTKYLKTKERPDGIPAWKFFFFYYFPNTFNTVVGNNWVVCAEPTLKPEADQFVDNTYLGYALEAGSEQTAIPFEERPHRVWLLAKYVWFFYEWMGYKVWEEDFYQRATDELRQRWPDFEIVGGLIDNRNAEQIEKQGEFKIPKGIVNLGKLNATQFDEELSKSRLLLGIGRPATSPSPYRALARGVPFLNPFGGKNKLSQHPTFRKMVPEPYNYNVDAFDYRAFVDAIAKAMETPIESHVPAWMKEEALDKRMRDFVERDWRTQAAYILEQRKAGNETQRSFNDNGGKLGHFEL